MIIPLEKVFNLEKWSQNRFNNQMDNYYGISINYTKTSSLNSSLSSLILGVPIVLLITFGGYMVLDGSISLGRFPKLSFHTLQYFSHQFPSYLAYGLPIKVYYLPLIGLKKLWIWNLKKVWIERLLSPKEK